MTVPTLPAEGTLLVLSSPMGVPLYSARGLTQTLTPIGASKHVRRTVNGGLVDLSLTQFQKYASTITCTDFRAPGIDGIWPGQILTVSCVAELAYSTTPQRPVVAGSDYTDGGFTWYRPQLTMRVLSLQTQMAEYPANVAWSLDLEEV